ncbi:MAG: pantetheine-phosphate adenylyltransferase [Sedimentibacter sp.]|uniref:pantetheine-phosphate adenylyltransferase n=1 Tax=Sedimentibacter sp. TaxID=1960295 RepID=UPI0031590277
MKVLYAGSFDPITCGHLDLIKRCSDMFDQVVVTVFNNSAKKYMFTCEERVDYVRGAVKDLKNVTVESSDEMVAQYCRKNGIKVVIRGLRAVSDYEYELGLSSYNKFLNEDLETLFMVASPEYSFISSSGVKEIARYDEKFKDLVPENVVEPLRKKLGR